MYIQGQLLCCSSREKKTGAPSLTPRGKFDWKLDQFRTNASGETPYLLIRGPNLVLFPYSMTDDGFIRSRSLEQYSQVVKIYYKKINYAARSYLKITRLLVVHSFFYWNCWKQLSQTTIEPQNSWDDSNPTDKWRHAIATGPGPSFRMNLFSLPSSLHEFYFLAISLAWILFCFLPHRPPSLF